MPKTKGERRADKRKKDKKMKVSGKGLNQTQQRIVETSANYICGDRWTNKADHGTGHVCANPIKHEGDHECLACGGRKK